MVPTKVSIAGAGRTASEDLRVFKGRAAERFEDGTVAFLGIAALRHGFEALELVGGMGAIERHTSGLQSELHGLLSQLMLGSEMVRGRHVPYLGIGVGVKPKCIRYG